MLEQKAEIIDMDKIIAYMDFKWIENKDDKKEIIHMDIKNRWNKRNKRKVRIKQ